MNISMEKPVYPELLWQENPREVTSQQAPEFHHEVEPDSSGLKSSLSLSTHLREQRSRGSCLGPSGKSLSFFPFHPFTDLPWLLVQRLKALSVIRPPVNRHSARHWESEMKYNHPSVSTELCAWSLKLHKDLT